MCGARGVGGGVGVHGGGILPPPIREYNRDTRLSSRCTMCPLNMLQARRNASSATQSCTPPLDSYPKPPVAPAASVSMVPASTSGSRAAEKATAPTARARGEKNMTGHPATCMRSSASPGSYIFLISASGFDCFLPLDLFAISFSSSNHNAALTSIELLRSNPRGWQLQELPQRRGWQQGWQSHDLVSSVRLANGL